MRNRCTVALAACGLIALFGCTEADIGRTQSIADFDAFARTVFDELRAHPIDTDQQVGLFGDLDVLAGENVVMGQYRYRIDTTGAQAAANMAFQVYDAETNRAIPVVLAFAPRDNQWHLEDAKIMAPESAEDSLRQAIASRLHTWVSAAVESSRP